MWLNGLSELHLLHEGLFFVFCCLMCLAGVSELLVVLVGLLFDSLFALFVACSCMLVGFNVLHCCAVWNSLLHHVFVHFMAVHVVCVCLVGLSDLHVVQRVFGGLLFCSFLFVVSCLIGVMMISVISFHVLLSCCIVCFSFSSFCIKV